MRFQPCSATVFRPSLSSSCLSRLRVPTGLRQSPTDLAGVWLWPHRSLDNPLGLSAKCD